MPTMEDHLTVEALVVLDRAGGALGDQLTAALRTAIGQGRLAPGSRLPSSRALAADLGLSRGVVVNAYEQLIAEGRLLSRRGSGTTVAPMAPSPSTATSSSAPVIKGFPARPADGAAANPLIDARSGLRPGVPDLGAFPRVAWQRAYERALGAARDADLD